MSTREAAADPCVTEAQTDSVGQLASFPPAAAAVPAALPLNANPSVNSFGSASQGRQAQAAGGGAQIRPSATQAASEAACERLKVPAGQTMPSQNLRRTSTSNERVRRLAQ